MSTAGPTGTAEAPPIVVRSGRLGGAVLLACGLIQLAFVVDGRYIGVGGREWIRWLVLGSALVLILSGLRGVRNLPATEIFSDRVEILRAWPLGPKTIPIDGVDDLEVKWNLLYRRSDDRKVAKLSPMYADQSDVKHLQTLLRG